MAKNAKKATKSRVQKAVTPALNKGMASPVLGHKPDLILKRREINGTLLFETERALGKPGLRRKAVFTGSAVSSYSVDPRNPSHFVRERADGTRTVGRVVKGQFRPDTEK